MKRRDVRGSRGFVAVGIAGVVVAALTPGCRELVAGENVDLATSLCELLVQCGDDLACPDEIALRLEDGSADFLAFADEIDCLGGCASARACRDHQPVCSVSTCSSDEACCGATTGVGVCGNDGFCCEPAGVPCDASSLPCCGDLGCNDGHCGDLLCRLIDAACDVGQQCCSGRCADGVCAAAGCQGAGSPCVVAADCCQESGPLRCEEGRCVPDGGCVCDPSAVTTCCGEGEVCFATGEGQSACAPIACPPPGAECGSNADCAQGAGCPGDDLYCDFTFIPYCAECLPPGAPCNSLLVPSGCCAGTSCLEEVCQ